MSKLQPRFFVLVLTIGLLGCGSCSSTPSADDEPPTEDGAVETMQWPASIPDSTRLLIRIDPERTDDLIDGLASHLGFHEQLRAHRQLDWGDATLQFILSGGSPDLSPSGNAVFSERKPGESIIVALGWPDDDPALRNLRLGAPYGGKEFADIPLGIRTFVPSQNPEALIDEVDDYCDGSSFACVSAPHTEVDDSYAVVDVPIFAHEPPPEGNLFAETNADVFDRKTLATRGFLQSDTAFSAYMRTESLPEWAALMGLIEMWMALEMAAPQDRLQELSRGLSFIHSYFVADSPEAREVEDFAATIDITDDGDIEVLNYETFTEQGRHIHSASQRDIEVPSIELDEPAFELEWSHDVAAARDASTTPLWFSQLADDDHAMAAIAETFRNGGIWIYQMTWSSYRTSFPAGFETLDTATGDTPNPLKAMRGLIGLRAALNFNADRNSPIGLAPRGAVVVAVESDSPAHAFAQRFLDDQRPFIDHLVEQLDLELMWNDEGSHTLLMLTSDGDDLFGTPNAIDEFRATFDATNVDVDSALIDDIAGTEIATMQQADLRVTSHRASSEAGLVTRLTTSRDAEPPEVPSMSVSAHQPPGPSDCFHDAISASPQGLEALSDGDDPRRLAYEAHKKVDAARASCDDLTSREADDLQWLAARWRSQMALFDIFAFRFDDARTHFDTACADGDDFGCQQHQALTDWDFQLAEIETPSMTLPALPSSVGGQAFPVATASGLFEFGIGRFLQIEFSSPTAIDALDPGDDANQSRLERLVHPVDTPDNELINLAYFAPDRSTPAGEIHRLIQLFDSEHFELSEDYKWNQSWELRDELSTDISGVAFVVDADVDDDNTPAVVFQPSDSELDDGSRLLLTLDDRGIDVAVGPNSLPPVDDCPDDGPTICVDDDQPWSDDAVFTQTRQLLDDHVDTTPQGVLITADEDIVFEAIAHSVSAVWASIDFEPQEALNFRFSAD